ncbi:MAG: YybH family protein [Thiobacillaceae bacterium]
MKNAKPDIHPCLPRRHLAHLALAGALPMLSTAAVRAQTGHVPSMPGSDLAAEVHSHEVAFAATMQRRDLNAFASFIAPDASFLNGGKPLRGRERIVAFWRRFFEAPQAPFQWGPDLVEVLPDGQLAMTLGPVRTLAGDPIARFYSVWRRESAGVWRVVFDNGYDTPSCVPPATR